MSLLGSAGEVGRVSVTLLRHRLISVTAGAAAAVIVAGSVFAATSAHASGQVKMVSAGDSKPITKQAPPPPPAPSSRPLTLLSVSPADGTRRANGGAPITLTFSSALSSGTPLPTLTPQIAGSWTVSGATATFTAS